MIQAEPNEYFWHLTEPGRCPCPPAGAWETEDLVKVYGAKVIWQKNRWLVGSDPGGPVVGGTSTYTHFHSYYFVSSITGI